MCSYNIVVVIVVVVVVVVTAVVAVVLRVIALVVVVLCIVVSARNSFVIVTVIMFSVVSFTSQSRLWSQWFRPLTATTRETRRCLSADRHPPPTAVQTT